MNFHKWSVVQFSSFTPATPREVWLDKQGGSLKGPHSAIPSPHLLAFPLLSKHYSSGFSDWNAIWKEGIVSLLFSLKGTNIKCLKVDLPRGVRLELPTPSCALQGRTLRPEDEASGGEKQGESGVLVGSAERLHQGWFTSMYGKNHHNTVK